jgi:hypothetical protein
VALSDELTIKLPSGVQGSLIDSPKASRAATVVTGGGAAPVSHPSMVVSGIDPVITGPVLSFAVIN